MSLYNYLARSCEPAQEIRSDFDQEQCEQLYKHVKALGYKKYHAFVLEHLSDILKYISLSHSQRQQKKWVNHPDNLLIRLAALQISCSTNQFLQDIEPIVQIVDSGSYRQFHSAIAAGVAAMLKKDVLKLFPFEEFDNPFEKKK